MIQSSVGARKTFGTRHLTKKTSTQKKAGRHVQGKPIGSGSTEVGVEL